jgi:nucleoside-diphosphate-sugar epimerase
MRHLVTGAAGFIGARVINELVRRGDEVIGFVSPGCPAVRLKAHRKAIRLYEVDLRDYARVASAVKAITPDSCLHLAWFAKPKEYLHSTNNIECLSASLNLLQLLANGGCSSFVGAGTCAEYRAAATALAEDSPELPESLYAATKLALCKVAAQYARLRDMRCAWGRIFYLYGAGEPRDRLLPSLLKTLSLGETFNASDAEQIRDYLHVDDVARGFVRLVLSRADGIYNICSGVSRRVKDIMLIAHEAAGGGGKIQFGN